MPRPVPTTVVVAAGSTAPPALTVAQGWLGPDVGRGGNFCERARPGAIAQPANTLSNIGFVLAELLVAHHAQHRRHHRPGAAPVMSTGVATLFACVVVLPGPGSAAMHATQSAWGGHLDMLSMYLVAGFAAALRGRGVLALPAPRLRAARHLTHHPGRGRRLRRCRRRSARPA